MLHTFFDLSTLSNYDPFWGGSQSALKHNVERFSWIAFFALSWSQCSYKFWVFVHHPMNANEFKSVQNISKELKRRVWVNEGYTMKGTFRGSPAQCFSKEKTALVTLRILTYIVLVPGIPTNFTFFGEFYQNIFWFNSGRIPKRYLDFL